MNILEEIESYYSDSENCDGTRDEIYSMLHSLKIKILRYGTYSSRKDSRIVYCCDELSEIAHKLLS